MKIKNDQMKRNVTKDKYVLEVLVEELKSRKYANALMQIRVEDPFRQTILGTFILEYMGLDPKSAQTLSLYNQLLNKHSRGIIVYNDSVTVAALKIVEELKEQKEKGAIQ
jgi:hypothetical protein